MVMLTAGSPDIGKDSALVEDDADFGVPSTNNFERDVRMFGPLSGIFYDLLEIRPRISTAAFCLLCCELTVSH